VRFPNYGTTDLALIPMPSWMPSPNARAGLQPAAVAASSFRTPFVFGVPGSCIVTQKWQYCASGRAELL
jgi:hypothetical protein